MQLLSFELLSFFPEDCVWGPWSTWSSCSKTCGSGTNIRSRSKTKTERNGGNCPGSGSDNKLCNTQSCVSPFQIRGGPGSFSNAKVGAVSETFNFNLLFVFFKAKHIFEKIRLIFDIQN